MIRTYFNLFVLEYNIIVGRLISLPYSSKDTDYVRARVSGGGMNEATVSTGRVKVSQQYAVLPSRSRY